MINRRKMNVAEAVLAIVEGMTRDDVDLWLEAYCNGREQGYCLWNLSPGTSGKKVCFAEYRNSDSIVVYSGETSEFSMQGNVPTDKNYERKNFFEFNRHYQAAEFIVDYLDVREK